MCKDGEKIPSPEEFDAKEDQIILNISKLTNSILFTTDNVMKERAMLQKRPTIYMHPQYSKHLAMVAREPAERAVQTRRVVTAHVDAAGAQTVPEAPGGPAETAQPIVDQPHAHPFPELLSFFGLDMDHPERLNAEVEFWMEDEKYTLNKSCMIYVPKGMKHCPLIIHRVDRPIFHFTTGPGKDYV